MSGAVKIPQEFLRDLRDIVSFPTISAEGKGLEECSRYLKQRFEMSGFRSELLRVEGAPPLLLAEARGRSDFTLIFYNHYDVQPVDPLNEWASQPFKLDEREGKLYARGIADNKGDLMARLHAIDSLEGELPVNVKFVVEGEEEVGSPHLKEYVKVYSERIKGDVCLWEGADVTSDGRPQVYLGVKGLLYVEIVVETASRDQHSMFAAVSPNPAWNLVRLLSKLRSEEGRVLIPGFYEDVKPLSEEEVKALSRNDLDPEQLRKELGAYSLLPYGSNLDVAKDLCSSPTCNIAGMYSGYSGKGAKTVLPRLAGVKIDFRLVPNQKPDEILSKLKSYIESLGYRGIKIEVHSMEEPARVPLSHPYVNPIVEAAESVYGKRPNLWPSIAGTGPMALFVNELGIPSVMPPSVSYAGSAYHAPNEHVKVEDYLKAVRYYKEVVHSLARLKMH